jgi:hypothetical protein
MLTVVISRGGSGGGGGSDGERFLQKRRRVGDFFLRFLNFDVWQVGRLS